MISPIIFLSLTWYGVRTKFFLHKCKFKPIGMETKFVVARDSR